MIYKGPGSVGDFSLKGKAINPAREATLGPFILQDPSTWKVSGCSNFYSTFHSANIS